MNNLENGNEIALVDYYLLRHRVELLQGDLEEAESTLLMALNFVKNMQDKERIGEISIIIGKFYIDNGNDKEAAKYLNEGVEMFKEVGLLKDM